MASSLTFDSRTGDVASGGQIDLCKLRFSAPKDAEDRGDSKVCTARAFLLPGKGALRLEVHCAELAKVTHSRRDAHTLTFAQAASQSCAFTSFLMSLDARVLEVAKASTDVWFMHKMNADLVEEYYRGSTAPTVGHGIGARFVIDATPQLPDALVAGARVDIVLQLIGLQFRPQYFTCVWKVLSSAASPLPEEAVAEQQPVRRRRTSPAAATAPAVPAFLDDEEGERDDDDAGEYAGPDAEQRAELRRTLMDRLMRLERDEQDRIDAVRDMIRVLDGATPGEDLGVIAEMDERLGELVGV